MSPTRTTSQLTKNLRISALIFVVLVALVTILGKGGGGTPESTPVNQPPTVALANTTATLAEDTDTSSAIKVADINITDDALGTNTLSLSGADAALFQIIGTELFLVAGAALDFATNPMLDVTVEVDDTAVGTTPDDTASLAITVTAPNNATLSGAQVVPAVTTNGSGTMTMTVNAARSEISYTLDYANMGEVVRANISVGVPGEALGDFMFLACAVPGATPGSITTTPPTCPQGSASITGTLTEADQFQFPGQIPFSEFVDALLSGNTFITLDTAAQMFGAEIRGQLGAAELRSVLSGDQEEPLVATAGSGSATVSLDNTQETINYTIDYAGTATVTQAHIHLGATGINGGILLFLCETAAALAPGTVPTPPTCPAVPGTVSGQLTAADLLAVGNVTTFSQAVDAVLSGNTYINVHTTDYPSGEIRGQVGQLAFDAPLSGDQEVPPVITMGSGMAEFVLDAAQTSLFYRLDYADTATITQAHVHVGASGANGAVILFLCQTAAAPAPDTVPTPPTCPATPGVVTGTLTAVDLIPSAGDGITNFADAIAALKAENTYVNVHSDMYPTGEIRGQISADD